MYTIMHLWFWRGLEGPFQKKKVDKLNLTKLATDFVLKYPKRESFFAVPE